ncbi:uncharacterized protein P884DRAFT_276243 [Thermothelomyces heterothallicus CBS 202.75]|uniref:uncharacterized protein n=1 Tax=Thermothelomyces heterothallicus CBS 202.75 TaxID=1149848 RepID=UPI0037448AEB
MTSRAETTRDQQAAGRNRASRPVVVERYLRVQVRKETAGPQKPGASEMYPFPRQGEKGTELAAAWDQVCAQRFPRPFEGHGMRRHGLKRCRVAALLGKTAGQ